MVIVGLLFLSNFLIFPLQFLKDIQKQAGQDFVFAMLFPIVFGCFGLWICWQHFRIGIAAIGILLNRTRTIVIAGNNELRVIEQSLWVSHRRKHSLGDIRNISIAIRDWSTTQVASEQQPVPFHFPVALRQGLLFDLPNEASFLVAFAYPESVLRELSRALCHQYGFAIEQSAPEVISLKDNPDKHHRSVLPKRDESNVDLKQDSIAAKYCAPPKTKITIERREDGIVLQIPSQGYFKGSHGLFAFSLCWLGFVCLMISMMVLSQFNAQQVKADDVDWVPTLGLSIFAFFGFGMLVYSINMTRRQITIATSDGILWISTRSLFGSKTQTWEREEIHTVCVAPSNMSVNDVPVLELKIAELGGRSTGLLNQLADEELHWIGYEIRQAIGILEASIVKIFLPELPTMDSEGNLVLDSNSRLAVDDEANPRRIEAKAIRDEFATWFVILIGGLFFTIGIVVTGVVILRSGFNFQNIGFFLVWTPLFSGIGLLAFMLGALRVCTHFTISMDDGSLSYSRIRPWNTTIQIWNRTDIQSVDCKATGFAVGDQALFALFLKLESDKEKQLLHGHHGSDLRYVQRAIENWMKPTSCFVGTTF